MVLLIKIIQSKSEPFDNQTTIDHLNTCYSYLPCISVKTFIFSYLFQGSRLDVVGCEHRVAHLPLKAPHLQRAERYQVQSPQEAGSREERISPQLRSVLAQRDCFCPLSKKSGHHGLV